MITDKQVSELRELAEKYVNSLPDPAIAYLQILAIPDINDAPMNYNTFFMNTAYRELRPTHHMVADSMIAPINAIGYMHRLVKKMQPEMATRFLVGVMSAVLELQLKERSEGEPDGKLNDSL